MNLPHVNKKDLTKRTKDFFQSNNWHKSLVFFIFVVLAFIFWLTQYYQQIFEVEIDIDIDYRNVPSDIVLSKSVPQKVTMKISDKGIIVVSYNFRKKKERVIIDLKDIDKTQTSYYVDQSELNTAIRNILSASTSLISFYPGDFTINYMPLIGKELPVFVDGAVTPAPGFTFMDSIKINPERVTAFADSVTLDTLHFIKTEPLAFQSVNKSLAEEINLVAPENANLSTYVVKLYVEVEEYTEKTFMIPLQINNMPDNMNVRLFPPEVEVTCYLPLSNYSQLTEEELAIEIDYSVFARAAGNSIGFDLTKKPHYIINYRFMPEKADFLIEKIK